MFLRSSTERSMPMPFIAALLTAVAACFFMQAAVADAPPEVVKQYADSCVSMAGTMANMPLRNGHKRGDGDLAGNPKLQQYCGCFGKKFADRAVTFTAPLSSKAEIEAAQQQELEMRNSCRRQYGLPEVPPK